MLLSCLLLLASTSIASAQQPKPGPAPAPAPKEAPKDKATEKEEEKKKAEAGKHYGEADKLHKEGKYEEALPLFQKADEVWPGHAPKWKIAECYDKLGKVPEAIAAYKAYLGSDPGEKYQTRIDTANQRIGELEATLPAKVTISVAPADAANVSISVDGNKLEGNSIELSAGEHTVIVTADGFQPKTEVVSVRGNEVKDLQIALNPVAKPAPTKPKSKPTKPAPKPEPKEERSNIPAYVTLGIAGAGIILGAVFGIQALSAKSDFDEDPTTDNADSAERAALIADMSFGVALTFGITGAVLLFSGGDDEPDEPEPASSRAVPSVTPYAGPKGGGMSATWRF